jgi:phosphatidylglycerophosphate synthase
VKPNTITFLGTFISFVGLYFYFIFLKIPAVILYFLGFILDWCDGPVARVTGQTSKVGAKLDLITDIFTIKLFHFILPLGLFFYYGELNILIVAFSLVTLMVIRDYITLIIHPGDRGKNYYYCEAVCSSDTYQSSKQGLKSKYSLLSKIIVALINFNYYIFPFIVLFNLKIILIFYFLNIFVELVRIIFNVRSTFLSTDSVKK